MAVPNGVQRVAVVMAGGAGERFWPVSTPERPKQLLRLADPERTMLEQAIERIAPLVGPEAVYISTTAALHDPILASSGLPAERVLAEPAKRNTLGALSWVVASLIARGYDQATVAVVTADHAIGDAPGFRRTVAAAMEVAEREKAIVTIGIVPNRPETGYGYIEVDQSRRVIVESGEAFAGKRFVEKPSHEVARQFLIRGGFWWNSGMFFFTVPAFVGELDAADPEAARNLRRIAEALRAGRSADAEAAFEALPPLSVDHGLMEKAQRIYVVPAVFRWDDLGAWDALERSMESDEAGNVVVGPAVLIDAEGSIVYSDSPEVSIGVLGIEDLVVVVTKGAVLVCPKDKAQRVKEIAARMCRKA